MKIALLTDIHEDIGKLTDALRTIEKCKADMLVCLGDISGFSAPFYEYQSTRNAHDCLNLIRSGCEIVILGNHDIHAAEIIPKHCNFFDFPDNWYALDYHERHALGAKTLWLHEENDLNPLYKESDLAYLRNLPEYVVFNSPQGNILFAHYVYPNISGLKKEFYTYTDEFRQHFDFMETLNCQYSFCGHAHTAGLFIAEETRLKEYKFGTQTLVDKKTCVGIPPVTRSAKRNGVCIFDTEEREVRTIRI